MDDAQYLNLMAKLNNIVARLDHISLQVTPPVSIPSVFGQADVKIHDQGILTSSSTEITHPTWMSSTTTTTTPATSARRRKRKGGM